MQIKAENVIQLHFMKQLKNKLVSHFFYLITIPFRVMVQKIIFCFMYN